MSERRRTTTGLATIATLALVASVPRRKAWLGASALRRPRSKLPIRPSAKAAGLAGYVFLTCRVDRQGDFAACDVSGETPEGHGFGKAPLGLTPSMKAAPREGGPPFASITVPVAFGTAVDRPVREKTFKTSDGRFSTTSGRFRSLAPVGPYWPDMALRTGLSGHAAIDCKVQGSGALKDCMIVGPRTTHPSFGQAMLAMARQGWMTAGPAPADATPPADGVWRFELDFPRHTLDDVR